MFLVQHLHDLKKFLAILCAGVLIWFYCSSSNTKEVRSLTPPLPVTSPDEKGGGLVMPFQHLNYVHKERDETK